MHTFNQLITLLKREYGKPAPPPAQGPFELVMWENACYLLPDDRRLEVFETLRRRVGLSPEAILNAPYQVLLPIAKRGGMRPEMRVSRWREIAATTLNEFGENLDVVLSMPYARAKKALKQFPTIGDPGAEKILLFCGISSGLPLDSNGLRAAIRVGWGRTQKSYASTYRSAQAALKPVLPSSPEQLIEAHLLLREHGKTLCKDQAPLCRRCPLAAGCNYAVAEKSWQ